MFDGAATASCSRTSAPNARALAKALTADAAEMPDFTSADVHELVRAGLLVEHAPAPMLTRKLDVGDRLGWRNREPGMFAGASSRK